MCTYLTLAEGKALIGVRCYAPKVCISSFSVECIHALHVLRLLWQKVLFHITFTKEPGALELKYVI